jgi:hypothetical protein
VSGTALQDGTIDVDLAGRPAAGSAEGARGFVGVAFRVQPNDAAFECFYLRPTNGRADDQVRRNHSTQYVAHPGWPWQRLRAETPSVYESYVDLVTGAWMHVRVHVSGTRATLYANGATQPTLIVNDLKLAPKSGAVALWIGQDTDAWFRDLRVVPRTPVAQPSPPGGAPRESHDKAYWRGIIQRGYAPPEGAAAGTLAAELSIFLGSPDPELRDEIAYSILTSWIYQKRLLDPEALRPLVAEWRTNLTTGIGTTGTDAVIRRSFSALMLSVIAARDNADPFLQPAEFRQLLESAVGYLGTEQDVRGYDPRVGWMHSAAHTADFLKFLGRSAQITPADQRTILEAVAQKMRAAPVVFTYGEDERMARAILSIVNRSDFDQDGFKRWLAATRPVAPTSALPDPAALQGNQNVKNLFAKLEVLLALDSVGSSNIQAARVLLRATLKDLF